MALYLTVCQTWLISVWDDQVVHFFDLTYIIRLGVFVTREYQLAAAMLGWFEAGKYWPTPCYLFVPKKGPWRRSNLNLASNESLLHPLYAHNYFHLFSNIHRNFVSKPRVLLDASRVTIPGKLGEQGQHLEPRQLRLSSDPFLFRWQLRSGTDSMVLPPEPLSRCLKDDALLRGTGPSPAASRHDSFGRKVDMRWMT